MDMTQLTDVLTRIQEFASEYGDATSVGGLGLSLSQWIQGWIRSKRTGRKELQRQTIDDYLEWLRRRNHLELVTRLEQSRETIEAVSNLIVLVNSKSEEGFVSVLARLEDCDRRIGKRLDTIAEQLTALGERDEKSHQFEEEYLKLVSREFGNMHMIGVKEMRDVRQSLSIAFVSLKVKERDPGGDLLKAEEVLVKKPQLTIRGPAGSGKSTLLSWVALQCTRHDDVGNPWRGGIPFLIPLRSLARLDRGQPSVRDFITYTINTKLLSRRPSRRWLECVLDQRRAIVLIDGVDELPPEMRTSFWQWLEEFVYLHQGNRVYVTSRYFPREYEKDYWNPPLQFASAELADLDDNQVREFIVNWHDGIIEAGLEQQAREELKAARDVLPGKLKEPINRRVRELCGTPLLCGIICALHWQEEGYLPAQRVDLYDRCCTMLLDERDRKRRIPRPKTAMRLMTLQDKEMIVQRLALSMMRNKLDNEEQWYQMEVSRTEASRWVKPNIACCSDADARRCSPHEVLDYLVERTGIVCEPANGRISFPHRTFQEYLAACAAGALGDAGDLARRANDDQWHGTVILAAGTKVGGVPFGNLLVEELLEHGEKADSAQRRCVYYALAVACLETAQQIASPLRKRVLEHIEELLPPRDGNDAKILSAAGDAILPALAYQRWRRRSAEVVCACARTIGLIGTAKARKMFSTSTGYGNDERVSVILEILACSTVHPLDLYRLRHCLQGWGPHGGNPLRKVSKQLLMVLQEVTDLGEATEIESLDWGILRERTRIRSHSELTKLVNCKRLVLDGDTSLKDLRCVSGLLKLEELSLDKCSGIEDLTPLSELTNLRKLSLAGCVRVKDLSPLAGLPKLECIDIHGIRAIASLHTLRSCLTLRSVEMSRESRDDLPDSLAQWLDRISADLD